MPPCPENTHLGSVHAMYKDASSMRAARMVCRWWPPSSAASTSACAQQELQAAGECVCVRACVRVCVRVCVCVHVCVHAVGACTQQQLLPTTTHDCAHIQIHPSFFPLRMTPILTGAAHQLQYANLPTSLTQPHSHTYQGQHVNRNLKATPTRGSTSTATCTL